MAKQRINVELLDLLGEGEYTYKELCDMNIFVDGAKTGNTKKAQITDLKQYFEIDDTSKRGKIIILYKKEKKEEKKFTRIRSGKYSEDIQELLIKTLYESKDNKVNWSINTILEKVSMINADYIKYRKDMDKLSKEMEIDKAYVQDFYSYHHKGLRKKVETALNNLRKRSLLMWSKVVMVDLWEVEIVYSEMGTPAIDENGQVICKKNKVFRKATENECRIILKSEKSALNKLKCKDTGEVVAKGLWKEYDELVYNNLKKTGISFYYSSYEIIFNPEDLKGDVVGDIGAIATKRNLNDNVCNGIIKCSKTRHENALEKHDIILCQSLDDTAQSKKKLQENELLCNKQFVSINEKIVGKIIKN